MSWTEFIVAAMEHTAWPIAVVVVAGILRSQIGALLGRLETLRHKETEFHFRDAVEQIERSAEESGTQYTEDQGFSGEVSRLKQVAEVVPKAAISQSWNLVDREISDLLMESEITGSPKVREVMGTLSRHGLSKSWVNQIHELRSIRNRVVNRLGVDMDLDHIYSYIELAAGAASAVRAVRSNNALQPTAESGG